MVEQILKIPNRNEICLAHIAVETQQRGKGYGEKLMHFLMKEAVKDFASYFVLDVSDENPRAQRLYERMEFKVHKHMLSKHKSNYGHVPNFYRMKLK